MGDILCSIMGLLDIVAGILILVGLGINPWTIAFAVLMAGKGLFSFL
ncbi:MAG: hypothetical protein KJ566_02435 [Nanoarchaeota archaeon]|nr:hypothetical protein [Nanoarchaeota archaeon]